jgi:hypothetical protein
MHLTGRIDIRATALEPIVHGAGTSGNTQALRTASVVLEDGTIGKVPMVSGNSWKHDMRDAAVRYAVDVMGVEDRSMDKATVDLLFSGGHLNKSGAAIDLTTARLLEALFPPLALFGYSAGNTMTESKVRVSNLHVVCAENAWRVPEDLREHPALRLRAGMLRIEEFGTRHDQATKQAGKRLLTEAASAAIAGRKTKALKAPSSDGPEERGDSAQMIYTFGAIPAGATLWGLIEYADLTELERAALASAWHYMTTERRGDRYVIRVGAKNAIGYGALEVEIRGGIRIAPPQYVSDTSIARFGDAPDATYMTHLRERKDEILAALRKAVS